MQSTNIVHEAEVQRQHIRLQLPTEITVGEHTYSTYDWSSGGFGIQLNPAGADAAMQRFAQGTIAEGLMKFQFDGFQLVVPMQFEVRYCNTKQQRIGCRFTNVDKRHIAIFQYLVSAYVAGEVVQIGDLLDVAGRNNYVTAAKMPAANDGLSSGQIARRKAQKLLWSALIVGLSLGLVLYLGLSFYERIYVVKATSAEVTADMISVDAPAGGKVNYVQLPTDAKVGKGDPLVSMMTDTGSLQSVDSPCDCIVKERLLKNNQHASKDQSLLMLAPIDAQPIVTARLHFEDAVKLRTGQEALLTFAGSGESMKGVVQSVRARGGEEGAGATVLIQPQNSISATQIDDPVEVTFDTGMMR